MLVTRVVASLPKRQLKKKKEENSSYYLVEIVGNNYDTCEINPKPYW